MESREKLRIGTRGSPLALHQTRSIVDLLRQHYTYLQDSSAIETVIIKTTGDREQSRLLAEIGGKGLFTKELDEAMLRDEIDLAIQLCDKIVLMTENKTAIDSPCNLIEKGAFNTLFPKDLIVFDEKTGSFRVNK